MFYFIFLRSPIIAPSSDILYKILVMQNRRNRQDHIDKTLSTSPIKINYVNIDLNQAYAKCANFEKISILAKNYYEGLLKSS